MNVNYMVEINALDDWELTHPLSPIAYKLMRKLLYLANKERFPQVISVPNAMLISLVNCSEDSLSRARNQLAQAGLIIYKGQKRSRPQYEICYFSHRRAGVYPHNAGIDGNKPQKAGINAGYPAGINADYPAGLGADIYINKTIYGQNGTGEEESDTEKQRRARERMQYSAAGSRSDERQMWAVHAYLDQLRMTKHADLFANETAMRQILYTDRFSPELIGEALEMTYRRHMRYPLSDGANYALQLLVDWTGRGISTAEELRESRDLYCD